MSDDGPKHARKPPSRKSSPHLLPAPANFPLRYVDAMARRLLPHNPVAPDPIREIATGSRHELLWSLAERLAFLGEAPTLAEEHWIALVDLLRHGVITFSDGVSTDSGPFTMEIGTDEAACVVAAVRGRTEWYPLRAAALGGKGAGDVELVAALLSNPAVRAVDWSVDRPAQKHRWDASTIGVGTAS